MASTDLTNLDGFVASAYYLDSTSYVICSSAGAITAPGGVTVTAGGITVTAGGATLSTGNLTITKGDLIPTAGGIRYTINSYTSAHNGTTMPAYGFIGLSSGLTTGSTMVFPAISTASSGLGVPLYVAIKGQQTTGAWSISMPASHLFAGSTYNHVAFSTATTALGHLQIAPVSTLAYAIMSVGGGVTFSTT